MIVFVFSKQSTLTVLGSMVYMIWLCICSGLARGHGPGQGHLAALVVYATTPRMGGWGAGTLCGSLEMCPVTVRGPRWRRRSYLGHGTASLHCACGSWVKGCLMLKIKFSCYTTRYKVKEGFHGFHHGCLSLSVCPSICPKLVWGRSSPLINVQHSNKHCSSWHEIVLVWLLAHLSLKSSKWVIVITLCLAVSGVHHPKTR